LIVNLYTPNLGSNWVGVLISDINTTRRLLKIVGYYRVYREAIIKGIKTA